MSTTPLTLATRVNQALAEVRPQILADGGDLELVALTVNSVQVRLMGACQSCPLSAMTLTMGIETALQAHAPEITLVELVD
ncbi:MAG TPA: NifU family protein [Candidatus Babeliales bacterium]|nr:NifU family protein [Candidatus Babeliales bacterium]